MDTQFPKKELKFGEVAVQKGFVTEAQLLECLTIQKQLADMGVQEAVGEILQKKGFLKPENVGHILKAMGIDVSPVPGYQIQAKLGQGGMGTVYKARQMSMNRLVALKILSPEMTKNKEFVERFLREARTAAQMNHKNIIQAYDAGVVNGIYYFAMEYINGATAADLLKKKGRFTEKRALEVVNGIAEAIDYLHQHGMVHRDIKPENIMISAEGAVKLCDFGLVKEVKTDLSVTRSGFTFGTPYYMSPEQIQGNKRLDSRSDLYSLGTCFFKMLTGKNVFEGADLQTILTKHLTDKPASPKHWVPDTSDPTCLVISKMLEKDRAYRYRQPRELIHDLRSVMAGGEPTFAKLRRSSGSPAGIAVAVGALVIALGLGGYFLLGNPKPPPAPMSKNSPVSDAPPTPDVKRPDPSIEARQRREIDAEKTMILADSHYEGQKWKDAMDLYARLTRDYADTDTVKKNKLTIQDRSARCKTVLDDIVMNQNKSAARLEAQCRAEFERAENEMIQGRFREAKDRLVRLASETLPEDLMPRVQNRLGQCSTELLADENFQTIRKSFETGHYGVVASMVQKFRNEFASTVTLQKKDLELKLMVTKSAGESECKKAIALARTLYDGKDWEGYRAFYIQLKRDFAESDSFKAEEKALAELNVKASQNIKGPLEQAAKDLLAQAEKEKSSSQAFKLYRTLLNEYGDTEIVTKRRSEFESKLVSLERTARESREKEAAQLLKDAKAAYDRKQYKSATELVDRLADDYPDTAVVKKEEAKIADLRRQIEREQETETKAFALDLSAGVGGWKEDGPGDKEVGEADEGPNGKKCMRLKMPGHEEGWTRYEHEVAEGFSRDLKRIVFRARSGERFPVNVILYLKMVDGDREFFYMAERQVAAGIWETYRVSASEFKQVPIRSDSAVNQGKIDFTKVRAIGFCLGPKQPGYILYVDQIRGELK